MNQLPPTTAPFVLSTPDLTPDPVGDDIDVYLPDGTAPVPAVIYVHGMPYPSGWPGPRLWPVYLGYGRATAERGAAGVVFTHSCGGEPDYEASAAKLATVIDAVRAHPRVDGDRVALWHFSGGSPLSADYLRHPPGWLKCLALTYPMLDDVRQFGIPRRLRPIDAVVDSGRLPVVLSNAGRERADLAEAVTRFRAAATAAEVDLTVIEVPDGQHGFDFTDHIEQSRRAVAEALDLVIGHLR